MSFSYTCPKCGLVMRVSEQVFRERIRSCPRCGFAPPIPPAKIPSIEMTGIKQASDARPSPPNKPTWDVFICHASEDKDEIVRPLADALKKNNLKVWYDEFELSLGDSLRRKIDHGLANSRYGAVILSPNFFKKEWAQKELDGLVAREDGKEKVILPIWHNMKKTGISKQSPTLTDKVAVSTERGLENVVDEILRVVQTSSTQEDRTRLVTNSYFKQRLTELLIPLVDDGKPMTQIILGPIARSIDYLPVSSDNVPLFNFQLPSFLLIKDMTSRRDHYEFELSDPSAYFQVNSDGFFHAYFPFSSKEEPKEGFIHDIIYNVSSFLIFAMKILKVKAVDVQQRIHVELTGLTDLELRIDRNILFGSETYRFSKRVQKATYEKDFNPYGNWHDVLLALCDIYRLLCRDLGIFDVSEETIRDNMKKILGRLPDFTRNCIHNNKKVLPAISLNEIFSEN